MAPSPHLPATPLRPLDASLPFTAKFNLAALITHSLSLLSSRTLSKSSTVLLAPLLAILVCFVSNLLDQSIIVTKLLVNLLISKVLILFGFVVVCLADEIAKLFPKIFGQPSAMLVPNNVDTLSSDQKLRIGVVLSGGQAPGGHNVISGIYGKPC